MREIRYVTGLYDYLDTLRRDHPRLLVDNCASGGRRIDFEMLRRALVLTRSDYLWDPIGQQSHTYGLAPWLPIIGIGAASLDPYSCRSGLGSHFALAADYDAPDPQVWQGIARALREQQLLRRLYTGDYYPLSPYSTAGNVWMAWQFDRPDLGQGLVQAFRRPECPEETATWPLRGLEQSAEYAVTDLDQPGSVKRTGLDLLRHGLTVRLRSRPAAAVFTYRKL
jgi:alpha-galactosidase